jgi:hypothetical protein
MTRVRLVTSAKTKSTSMLILTLLKPPSSGSKVTYLGS